MKADTIMAADYIPTLGALPLLLFVIKKSLNTILLDIFKVINHAHPEKGFITFINMKESFARETLTFITVFYLSFQE
jgi:hypothetical protein